MSFGAANDLAGVFTKDGFTDEARRVLDILPVITFALNPRGEVIYANTAAVEYVGESELKDIAWALAIHPDDLSHAISERERWIAGEREAAVQMRLKGHDGEYRMFVSTVWPVRDAEGSLLGWYGTNTDIENVATATD